MFRRINFIASSTRQVRHLSGGSVLQAVKKHITEKGRESGESERMKQFRERLKSDVDPGTRFGDFVLLETDEKTGEAVANSEKDPTKWGDWQYGGRVSDF